MRNSDLGEMEMITCSYGPDLERCRRLCESVDRFVDQSIGHTLIVPARDARAFSSLANQRRKVVIAEDVLPGRYRQLPRTNRFWIDQSGWPVRGWILQQLIKLSADSVTSAELIVFADSDLQFVRQFDSGHVYRDGRLRLHRVPGAMNEGRHARWHRRASALLGRPSQYFGSDYVGQLITWRRSQLIALQQHISAVQRKPWHVAVARSLDFSEYTLYGSFTEHVSGDAENGHFYESEDLCHCCWFSEQTEGVLTGESPMSAGSVALLIQSNLGLAPDQEAAVLSAALQSQGQYSEGAAP